MARKLVRVPDEPVIVKNRAEKNAYIWLRMAEEKGLISHLAYEPASWFLGRSQKGTVRRVPDFMYIDEKTGYLVAMEIKGYRRPNVARGEALFQKMYPWIRAITVSSTLCKAPTSSNENPFYQDCWVPPIELKLQVVTAAEWKKRKR